MMRSGVAGRRENSERIAMKALIVVIVVLAIGVAELGAFLAREKAAAIPPPLPLAGRIPPPAPVANGSAVS